MFYFTPYTHTLCLLDKIDVIKYLVDHKVNINAEDKGKRTALSYAADNNYTEIVKYLIDSGSDANAGDNDKRTPLHLAATKGNCTFFLIFS